MKSISLIYGYSPKNAGDFAITLGAIDILIELGYTIKLFSLYTSKSKEYHSSLSHLRNRYGESISVYECPFTLNREGPLLQSLYNYADGLLSVLGLKPNKQFKDTLLSSDLVAFNGGNLFRCESLIDFTRLLALLYPLRIASGHGKKFIILPQSASRLNHVGKKMLLPIIRKASAVCWREKLSYQKISEMVPTDNFVQTIDLAFFIRKNLSASASISETLRKKIAITLRFYTVGDIALFGEEVINQIMGQMDYLVTSLSSKYDFSIIVQTNKDYELSERFAKKHQLNLRKSNDPIELLSIYKNVDMLVGMRLHSIILALSVGTPCFGYFYKEWGLKNPGLMEYFDMPYILADDNVFKESHLRKITEIINQKAVHSQQILSIIDTEKTKLLDSLKNI